MFVTVPIELEGEKSVLTVAPGTVDSNTRLIHCAGEYWLRDFNFEPANRRAWVHIPKDAILCLV
jgi:hypothetical protein